MSDRADEAEFFVTHVRSGELADEGSWVYAWLRAGAQRRVVYVGVTGMHPATRA